MQNAEKRLEEWCYEFTNYAVLFVFSDCVWVLGFLMVFDIWWVEKKIG